MPWKKITVTYGETGVGVDDRVETEYQFGDEIDGVWVPAVTKASGYIDHLIQREKDAQAAAAAAAPADQAAPSTPAAPTSGSEGGAA